MKYNKMKNKSLFLALVSGAISGALILGIAGRTVIALLSLYTGSSINLSLGGILQNIFLGIIIGSIGGILLFIVKNLFQINRFNSAILTGLILFVGSLIFAVVSDKFVFDGSIIQLFALIVVVMMFLLYGVFAAALLKRVTGNWISYS